MDSIRIKFLRSIKDSGYVKLKPFTILIGKNSSGKSSFIRTFPLFKQTLLSDTSDSFLWYGDSVDFGNYSSALSTHAKTANDLLEFDLCFHTNESSLTGNIIPINIEIKIFVNNNKINKFEFYCNNLEYFKLIKKQYARNEDYDLYVNGIKQNTIFRKSNYAGSFLPHLQADDELMYTPRYAIISAFRKLELDIQQNHITQISRFLSKLYVSDEEVDNFIKNIFPDSLCSKIESISKQQETEIRTTLKVAVLNHFLNHCENYIRREMNDMTYFKPLRTSGTRFYRVQGLNIKNVDSDGKNAPMILYSMKKNNREKFESWCLENFGFSYKLLNENTDNISIGIYDNDLNEQHNLTDTGFGYSQILPIVLLLWTEYNSKTSYIKNSDSFIIIEQPELHLHPSFQYKIMRAFAKIVKYANSHNKNIKFIIETHSESIVNSLGNMLRCQAINKNDINLVICSKTKEGTNFKQTNFNDRFLIDDWPYGFFNDEDL